MYVPATPPQPAPALAPVGVVTSAPAIFAAPLNTSLEVRKQQLNVLAGDPAYVAGSLLEDHHPGLAGRVIDLQQLIGRRWRTVATARTHGRGRFRMTFRPGRIGTRLLRLRYGGGATATGTHRRLGALNVYHLAGASWYGGGGGTACGEQLTSSMLGVASKTLPCGTLVTLRYGDRMVRVPVIDRGPYVEGREFDLTEATKRALGFGDTGDVWSTN